MPACATQRTHVRVVAHFPKLKPRCRWFGEQSRREGWTASGPPGGTLGARRPAASPALTSRKLAASCACRKQKTGLALAACLCLLLTATSCDLVCHLQHPAMKTIGVPRPHGGEPFSRGGGQVARPLERGGGEERRAPRGPLPAAHAAAVEVL